MARICLTARFVRTAACPPDRAKIDFFDVHRRGFMLEVRQSGGKTFYQRYRDERGRERQFKIGPADAITLEQARRKARQVLAEAILGPDPHARRQQLRSIPTFAALVKEYYLPFARITNGVGERTKQFCGFTSFLRSAHWRSTRSPVAPLARSSGACAIKATRLERPIASSFYCVTSSTWLASGTYQGALIIRQMASASLPKHNESASCQSRRHNACWRLSKQTRTRLPPKRSHCCCSPERAAMK